MSGCYSTSVSSFFVLCVQVNHVALVYLAQKPYPVPDYCHGYYWFRRWMTVVLEIVDHWYRVQTRSLNETKVFLWVLIMFVYMLYVFIFKWFSALTKLWLDNNLKKFTLKLKKKRININKKCAPNVWKLLFLLWEIVLAIRFVLSLY